MVISMKILLICDDLWHSGEAARFGLSFLAEQGHTIDTVYDAKDIITPEYLSTHDVTIIAKGNSLTSANHTAPWFEEGITWVDPTGYQKYVEEGGGVIFLHAGTTFHGDNCPAMSAFLGVEFKGHPPQCPVEFHVTNPDHPVMKGISDFTFPQDEHYQIEITAKDLEVFAESKSTAGSFPAGLGRELGNGRVCVLTPGHNAFAINYPEYQKVINNALDWVTKRV